MTDARTYMESIRAAEISIQMKKQRVLNLRESLTSLSMPIDQEHVTHTRKVDVMGETVALINDMEKEYEQQIRELCLIERKVFQLLDKIKPDSARILTEYYLENRSTKDLARTMFISRRHVQRRIKKALAELQAVLDSE